MLTRGKAPSGGLSSAMGYFKLHFKGKAHRADVDAANTLALFFNLLERQSKLENLLDTARAV
jgi:inhibitor of KinA sporulation pathway (predicted exonuclease)